MATFAGRQVYEGRTYSYMQPGAAGADGQTGNLGASRRLLEGAMRALLLQNAHVELVPGCVVSDLAWSPDGRSVRGGCLMAAEVWVLTYDIGEACCKGRGSGSVVSEVLAQPLHYAARVCSHMCAKDSTRIPFLLG